MGYLTATSIYGPVILAFTFVILDFSNLYIEVDESRRLTTIESAPTPACKYQELGLKAEGNGFSVGCAPQYLPSSRGQAVT
jgi:hypothetical protein